MMSFYIASQKLDQNFTNRGTPFADFLEESSIPINQMEHVRTNNLEKSDVSIQSANEKEFETFENSDQAFEKQINIENNKCLDSRHVVPITESNSLSARDRNLVRKNLQTYVRKKISSKVKSSSFSSHQESKPRTEPNMSDSSGKNSSDPEIDDLDLPIAFRKVVRSCTKYSMSNYVSYDKLSPTLLAFTSQLSYVEIPNNIPKALRVLE